MRSVANDRKNIFRAQPGERLSCDQSGLTFSENTHFLLCFVFCLGQYCHRGFFMAAEMNNTGNVSCSSVVLCA